MGGIISIFQYFSFFFHFVPFVCCFRPNVAGDFISCRFPRLLATHSERRFKSPVIFDESEWTQTKSGCWLMVPSDANSSHQTKTKKLSAKNKKRKHDRPINTHTHNKHILFLENQNPPQVARHSFIPSVAIQDAFLTYVLIYIFLSSFLLSPSQRAFSYSSSELIGTFSLSLGWLLLFFFRLHSHLMPMFKREWRENIVMMQTLNSSSLSSSVPMTMT